MYWHTSIIGLNRAGSLGCLHAQPFVNPSISPHLLSDLIKIASLLIWVVSR